MTILDRYLTRQFVTVLIFSLIAFISIFIIIDFVEKLDDYLNENVPKLIIFKYYIYQLPYIIVLTLPVAMLLSSLFSIGKMARQNEIVAMKAAGLSLYRLLLPIFILAFLVSCLAIFFGETVVPFASTKTTYITDEYLEKKRERWRKRITNIYVRDDQGRRISMRSFDAVKNIGTKVSVQRFEGQSLVQRLDAQRIVWEDSVWVLYNGAEHRFVGGNTDFRKFDREILRDENLKPSDFSKVLKKTEEMSFEELKEFIAEVRRNGGSTHQWLVDLYLKIAIPFANFIIVLFGAPLSSPKRRGGAATGFGISLAICFVYFGTLRRM